ncbi:MAG: DUF1735 domain-containing protein [Niabella sp.]
MKHKKFLSKFYTLIIIAIGVFYLSSCKKNEESISNNERILYAAPGNAAYNVSAGTAYVLKNEVVSDKLGFPVYLSRPFTNDVNITAVIDTNFLKQYDSVYKTTSPRFKASAFELDNNGLVTVKAGQTASADSIRLLIKDTVGMGLGKVYVVPVRLVTSTAGVPLSSTRQVMYIKAGVTKVVSNVAAGVVTVNAGFTSSIKTGPAVGFPAMVNVALSKSVTISFADDPGLVATYNAANTTNYTAMSAGTYTLAKNSVTIPAGATASTDSVQVRFPDLSAFTSGASYLLPVRIKDEGAVTPGTTNNVRYILLKPVSAVASIPALGSNIINLAFALAPNGTVTGQSQTGFSASVNAALGANSTVTIVDDASLIAAYNSANGTSYAAFPANTCSISKNSVIIPAGATNSGVDSFKVQFTNFQSFAEGDYLLPVRIQSGTGSDGLSGDPSRSVVYIHVNVFQDNIDPTNSGLTGTTMSRTDWSATASSVFTSAYAASNTIDGNNNTSWFAQLTSPGPYLQIDMGTQKTIKGFSIVPNYGAFGILYNFLTMEVLTSNDGNIWTSQGKYSGTVTSATSSATNPDLKIIRFISPVTAQYYRFRVLTGSNAYTGIGEINGIE